MDAIRCTGDSIPDKTSTAWANYFSLWWGLHKGANVGQHKCPLCDAEIYEVKTFYSEDKDKIRSFVVHFECRHVWYVYEARATKYYCDKAIDTVERWFRKLEDK